MKVAQGGPMAAPNIWGALRWWSTRLGLQLPLEHRLVEDFRFAPRGHQTKQAKPLPLPQWGSLIQRAS